MTPIFVNITRDLAEKFRLGHAGILCQSSFPKIRNVSVAVKIYELYLSQDGTEKSIEQYLGEYQGDVVITKCMTMITNRYTLQLEVNMEASFPI